MAPITSPFLTPQPTTAPSSLALISLKRDQTTPVLLHAPNASDPTDHITNTRFGSFPHSTLLNRPWGSQIIASNVGARERKRGKKRKAPGGEGKQDDNGDQDADPNDELPPAFEAAASGFAHILPPTPELWTTGLPHRTQVVYTPDYSYVLSRLRVRPGSRVIEAGAGSGSFTHAAVRQSFSGYPATVGAERAGKVFSFEYHEPRYDALREEIAAHGLTDLVRITHRDVYADGFGVDSEVGGQRVDAIFLDLPAPWLALPHITRKPNADGTNLLSPNSTIRLCSFSPCMEQVQRTVDTLRELGWVDVGMAAMHQKRIDVRRDRVGLQEEGLRGVNAVPGSVDEALGRLREMETKTADYHARRRKQLEEQSGKNKKIKVTQQTDDAVAEEATRDAYQTSRQERLASIAEAAKVRKLFKEGLLVHRTEPELKTHTSYLVFANLPREWSEEDERRCEEEWIVSGEVKEGKKGKKGR